MIKTSQTHLYFLLRYFWLIIIITFQFTNRISAQQSNDKAPYEALSSCEWHFGGHLGEYFDRIAEKRILNLDNWNMIYPETEEAFRLREDDKDYPVGGNWIGMFWGDYLLSTIAACRYYHSDDLKNRIAAAVKGVLSTQEDNGYIGTYAHSDFVDGTYNWNVWNSKYTLWCLVESWELLGDETILTSAKRLTDYLISVVGPGAVDIVKTGNFYGIASSAILQPIVKLYTATGERKYLDYAEYIVNQWGVKYPEGLSHKGKKSPCIYDILNKGLSGVPVHKWFPDPECDPNDWAKTYEFTSCVEGLVELYKATGEKQYLEAAKNIHAGIVNWERSPVGSVSFNDKYVGSAGLINTISEICDAVYWNRLSFALFEVTGDEKYIEEIERTLYNSLLCGFNIDGTWGLRRLRMSHIHIPGQNQWLQHHQCCTDNLPRGLFQAAESALLTTNNGNIYLSLFNEGQGDAMLPSGRKIHIQIDGDFFSTSGIRTTLSLDQAEQFGFVIRMPKWSKQTTVKVNGVIQRGNTSDNWMMINRMWKDGDIIEISFELEVRWETFDTTKFTASYHDLDFYENIWARWQYVKGDNEENNRRFKHITGLSADDALPAKPAVTFFYGPIALARDVRVTGPDVFFPVRDPNDAGFISIRPVQAPLGIWKVFELDLGEGQNIKFCDFSSAGNTWSKDSQFNTWCIINPE